MKDHENKLWDLMERFIIQKGLVRQHIDSFDDFIDNGLQEIIDEIGEVSIEVEEYPMKINYRSLSLAGVITAFIMCLFFRLY